ncbi:hypothetical protein [Microbacterium jejuense]|uniref:hypothetical protein n=1 Tax=Microbacterium jejuense TaxID=1263637 RepID=UPI0031EEDB69
MTAFVSAGSSWESRLNGRGSGGHTLNLHNSGIPRAMVQELVTGNKYTIAQLWGDHVAFAGVIQRARYRHKFRTLQIDSQELRGAYMNARMLYGVGNYETTTNVLKVDDKSRSGATRAVIETALPNSDWTLPIDLPADGSGGFSAEWFHRERLTWEDHLAQIEADGCEIAFIPYLTDDGFLRWDTKVMSKIALGDGPDLNITAPSSTVLDLEVVQDWSRALTGVLGFGQANSDAVRAAAMYDPGETPFSVRDLFVNYPDITSQTRLQAAVDKTFAERLSSTEQWVYGLQIWPDGPAKAGVGRRQNLWSYGDPFIADGKHEKRVLAAKGDMGFTVTVEVQNG